MRLRLPIAALALGHFVLGAVLLPTPMFSKYPDGARLLWAGTLGPEEGADFSPLYLLINAVVGAGPLRLLQSVLGALCVVAIFAVARTMFSELAGWSAAGLFAIAQPVLLYEATLEPDLIVTALNLGAITVLVTRRPAWVAGIALGLSMAARPTALPFLVLAALWLWWSSGRKVRPAAVLVGAAVLTSLVPPFVLRTAIGQDLGGTMSAGPVFQQSHRPEGTGLGAQPPLLIKLVELQVRSRDNPDPVHGLYRQFARAEGGEALTPSQTQRFWIAKTLAFAGAEPAAYAALLGRKLCFFVFGPDGHDIQEVRLAAARLDGWPLIPTAWLGLMGTFALALFLAARKPVGLLAVYLATTAGLAVGFYVVSRFRLASVPVWCVLAAGLVHWAREALAEPKRLVMGALAATALIVFAAQASAVGTGRRMIARGMAAAEPAAQLDAARRAGRLTEAKDAFVRAQAAQPYVVLTRDLRGIAFEDPALARASGLAAIDAFGAETPTDQFLAAVLAARAGNCVDALPTAARAADDGFWSAIFDQSLDPDLFAARCLLEQGDREGAQRHIARSLATRPGTIDGLALATAGGSTPARAELFALHDLLSARFALGKAQLAFGAAAAALAEHDAVLAVLPDAGVVLYERARCLVALGRGADAASAYGRALDAFPGHAFATRPFNAVVEAQLAAAQGDAAVLALASEHRLRAGDIAAARDLAARATTAYGARVPERHRAREQFLMLAQ